MRKAETRSKTSPNLIFDFSIQYGSSEGGYSEKARCSAWISNYGTGTINMGEVVTIPINVRGHGNSKARKRIMSMATQLVKLYYQSVKTREVAKYLPPNQKRAAHKAKKRSRKRAGHSMTSSRPTHTQGYSGLDQQMQDLLSGFRS